MSNVPFHLHFCFSAKNKSTVKNVSFIYQQLCFFSPEEQRTFLEIAVPLHTTNDTNVTAFSVYSGQFTHFAHYLQSVRVQTIDVVSYYLHNVEYTDRITELGPVP